jgi:hypothetical protein
MITGENQVGLERYGPVEIRRQLETTSALLTSINGEVVASPADGLFKAKWGDLYKDWLEFYQDKLGATGIVSHLRDSTFDRSAAFRREALKFRYALIKAKPLGKSAVSKGADGGGGIHLPKIPDINLPGLPSINLPTFPWRTLAYGGVAVLGGMVLVRIVSSRSRC